MGQKILFILRFFQCAVLGLTGEKDAQHADGFVHVWTCSLNSHGIPQCQRNEADRTRQTGKKKSRLIRLQRVFLFLNKRSTTINLFFGLIKVVFIAFDSFTNQLMFPK